MYILNLYNIAVGYDTPGDDNIIYYYTKLPIVHGKHFCTNSFIIYRF